MNRPPVGWAVRVAAALVLLFLALPILIIFPLALNEADYLSFPPKAWSLRWFESVLTDPNWVASMWFSLKVAVFATLFSVMLSLGAAVALVRGRIRFKQGVYAIILLPMIVPNIISAVSMFFFFADVPLFGTVGSIVIGHTILALPVAVIMLSSTLQGVDGRLENAAMSLGASRLTAFRRITLPLIAPGLISAGIFAFLSSFDELLVAMFMAGHGDQTLPVRIWSAVQFQLDPGIAAISALLVLVSIAALLLAQFATMRRR